MATRPVPTHAPNSHQHQTAGPEAMEVAVAEEDFRQEKEEGEMTVKRRRATNIGLEGTTLTGTATEVAATTTRDEQDVDPRHQDATFAKTERCSPGAGREKEDK